MSDPGRIVFFAAYPHMYGGNERGLELLANGLLARGWAVGVVVPSEGEVAERLRAAGIAVDVVEAPPTLRIYGGATTGRRAIQAAVALPAYWARLRRRMQGADVVHTFAQRAFVLAGPAARLARVPLVWQVGGADPGRVVNEAAARTAHAVIAVSRAAATDLPRAARVHIVPVAVDSAAFDPPPSQEAVGVHIVTAARLTPEKGVDILVRAAAILRERISDLRVLVIGGAQDGHEAYRDELTRLTADLGVRSNVSFRGRVDQPFRHWGGARVYVQPSRREGFGLAAGEAMASGLPVVATDVGGLAEVVDDAGVLVAPDDPQALADAVAALLDDPERAARLAAAGRERAAATYTLDRMVDGVEAVYRTLSRA
ncbi:MAG: glycosyltransferase family 4 protein [Acidimicrobiia bacterium]|nr:glycosyltransferase family 4 protein [Acidimicrobiia bacterium]